MKLNSKTKLDKLFEKKRIAETLDIFEGLSEHFDKEFQSAVNKVLESPMDVSNWEAQIATRIGEARKARATRDLLTVTLDGD